MVTQQEFDNLRFLVREYFPSTHAQIALHTLDQIAADNNASARHAVDAPKPAFFVAVAFDSGASVMLTDYCGHSELDVKIKVLEVARREGFEGTANDRMRDLGWSIQPVYPK